MLSKSLLLLMALNYHPGAKDPEEPKLLVNHVELTPQEMVRSRRISLVQSAIERTIVKHRYSVWFEESRKLSGQQIGSIATLIVDYCDMYDVPVYLYLALIRQESAFNPRAVSPTGAAGLSQLVPSTARRVARDLGVETYDVYDVKHNIRFGVYYLSLLLRHFENDTLALQAYNIGPEYVKKALQRRDISLPEETIVYERRIQRFATEYVALLVH